MLRTIIEKEILENILTLRFITAFILCIGLVTISAFVLSNDYAQQLEDYHARVKIHAETANPELINLDRRPSGLAAMFSGMAKESVQTVKLMIDAVARNEAIINPKSSKGLKIIRCSRSFRLLI